VRGDPTIFKPDIEGWYTYDETVFVSTVDHGMSKLDNNGGGGTFEAQHTHPQIRTSLECLITQSLGSLIAWGKDIRGHSPVPTHPRTMGAPMGFEEFYLRDVEQADVEALMATLIGINWSINSVGVW